MQAPCVFSILYTNCEGGVLGGWGGGHDTVRFGRFHVCVAVPFLCAFWCSAAWFSLALLHELDAPLPDFPLHFYMNLMLRCLIFIGTSTWTWCSAAWCSFAFLHELDAPLPDVNLHFYMNLMLRCLIFICICTWTWCSAVWFSFALVRELDALLPDFPLHFYMNLMLCCLIFLCISTWTWCSAACFFAFLHELDAPLPGFPLHFYMNLMLRCLIFLCISTWTWCSAAWFSLALLHELDAPLPDFHLCFYMNLCFAAWFFGTQEALIAHGKIWNPSCRLPSFLHTCARWKGQQRSVLLRLSVAMVCPEQKGMLAESNCQNLNNHGSWKRKRSDCAWKARMTFWKRRNYRSVNNFPTMWLQIQENAVFADRRIQNWMLAKNKKYYKNISIKTPKSIGEHRVCWHFNSITIKECVQILLTMTFLPKTALFWLGFWWPKRAFRFGKRSGFERLEYEIGSNCHPAWLVFVFLEYFVILFYCCKITLHLPFFIVSFLVLCFCIKCLKIKISWVFNILYCNIFFCCTVLHFFCYTIFH